MDSPTTSSFDNVARVYLNNNGVLSSIPDWSADLIGNSFGVDFRDMNNDGRPDLANEPGKQLNGSIKIDNIENPSDFEIISVSLSTPVGKQKMARQNIHMLLFEFIKQIKRLY